MFRKFIVLALVLSFAGMASAANLYFYGATGTDWNSSLAWDTNYSGGTGMSGLYPTVGDMARIGKDVSTISTLAGTGIAKKLQFRGRNSSLTVQNGAVLTTDGSVEIDAETAAGGSAVLTIDVGGTVNGAEQAVLPSSFTQFKIGRANKGSDSIVNVNGTLNAISQDTITNYKSIITFGIWSAGNGGGGNWTLNIGAAGVVNADGYLMNTNAVDGTALINITTGGKMVLLGDVRTQVQTDVIAGLIKGNGVAGAVGFTYDGSYTTITVIPEPMTIALLGLGGLLLRKRR